MNERIEGILAGEWWTIPIVPPGGPAADSRDPPLFEVHGFNNLPKAHVFEDGRPDIPFAVFQPAKLPYLYLQALNQSAEVFDVRRRRESGRFLATAQAVARLLRPSFVAIDDMAAFEGPGLHDPRSRAWGVTYYGPDLVEALGGPGIVRSSPAWRVEEDASGFWVHLDETPFVDSGQRAARREAVEAHLDLAGRFPN
ncbi:MAG TPA: hypothetical protein VM327_09780 [Candidatus Thermoplasmatota archaeon]|nr:hypothetical protein [Candidatus Thermoplasmatota archaeon]